MKKIRVTSVILTAIIILSAIQASASVLGSSLIDGYTVEIGYGISATHNTWMSDQSGVGQQTENYVSYMPNNNVEPIITGGDYVYGKSTIEKELSRIRSMGITPLAGTNADFFSFQTGVPMSNIIADGKILTKDGTEQYGIGILDDNTAFMSKFTLYSVMTKEDGTQTNIYNINKYRQPYAIYMMTDEFSTQTHNTTKGIDVILGSIEGETKIGTEMTATVEYNSEYSGSIAIPEGKIVLTVDSNAPAEFYEPIASLAVGEKITISYGVTGDERWKNAKFGIGATGGMLLENGIVNPNLEAGANPRTALGIKSDGSILLYTIDGRQKGYSYGVQLRTLANRLKELGCVNAINLDGGGSTSFVMQFPGDSITTLNNKPSEGSLRSVSNFIFFKNNMNPTGTLGNLTLYPLTSYVLTGASVNLSVKASDTSYHAMAVPADIQYYVQDGYNSTVDNNGKFTAKESGTVKVYASSGAVTGSTNVVCLDTPTDMIIKNEANNNTVTSLNLKRTESVNLTADAYAGYNKLIAQDNNFVWTCDSNIGTIDESGTFTAGDVLRENGNIYVKTGEKTIVIPVNVSLNGSETEDEMFTQIDVSNKSPDYTINLSSNYGMTVKKEDITLKVNGNKYGFNYADNVITFTLPENALSLTLFVTNSEGYTSFYTDKFSNGSVSNPFIDTSGHWAESLISYMYSNRIINGENTSSGLKFNPDKPMTRSEFAVMITNYLGINTSDYSDVDLPYADTSKIAGWALNNFKALYKLGIIQGASDTDGKLYANPINNITRAETAVIISRTMPNGIKVTGINSSDKNEIADWAYDGIGTLVTVGAINGYEDNTIRPLRSVTKAEAAKILYTII